MLAFNLIFVLEKPLSITVLNFIILRQLLKISMGHAIGILCIKIFTISFHIFALGPNSILSTKFQLDWTILKNRYGSPHRVTPVKNFSTLTSHSFIRSYKELFYQISAFYDNFEILVHNTPPTYMTPTGHPLDRFRPSSNLTPHLPHTTCVPNFKSIG